MKSYTDLEQSKKLSEFLPIESADMYYPNRTDVKYQGALPIGMKHGNTLLSQEIPCWSLVVLFDTLPLHLIVNNQLYAFSMHKGLNKNGETYVIRYNVFNTDITLCETDYFNNLVDACYEMILKLHELNLL